MSSIPPVPSNWSELVVGNVGDVYAMNFPHTPSISTDSWINGTDNGEWKLYFHMFQIMTNSSLRTEYIHREGPGWKRTAYGAIDYKFADTPTNSHEEESTRVDDVVCTGV